MNQTTKEKLELVNGVLGEAEKYSHAVALISYDMETICPSDAMEEQGELMSFLGNKLFLLIKDEKFIEAGEYLYEHRDELGEFDKALAEQLHRDYRKIKNLTPEKQLEFSRVYNKAFVDWTNARKNCDFSLFADSLQKVKDVTLEDLSLREKDEETKNMSVMDELLNDYERGMGTKELDACFEHCKERLVPLLKKIQASKKAIRTDFMHRKVTDEQQKKMTEYLMSVIKYDRNRGTYALSEHPFTNLMAKDDVRITTHFYEDDFASNMYSVIHEGGHALFEMYQPAENFEHHINTEKTLGMHESVSRMYENRIGRSKSFVHLIYPKVCEIFPEAMFDVSEEELYEALNEVKASLIRTEADEFTYTFHIIIRYELEKEIIAGTIDIADLPKKWNEKYEEYLGVTPTNDREGVLQDVHWSSGFGYFPTYSIGNMYNSMYYKCMDAVIDVDKCVEAGDFDKINGWMKENVFKKADRLDPADWIKDITGRDFTPDDFLDYLEEKYSKIYEL